MPNKQDQHATTEELFETVFSAVRANAVATQRCGKRVSAVTNPDTVEELYFLLVRADKV
jgi:hypothetical protein